MEPAAAPVQQIHKVPIKLLSIEFYVCLTAALLGILVISGSFRRSCSRKLFRMAVSIAYTLCGSLISYTIGRMQSAPFHNQLFATWACFLLIFLGSADSMSAYSLHENEDRKRYYWQFVVQSFWLGWFMGEYGNKEELKIQLWVLFVVIIFKIAEKDRANFLASRYALATNTKLITDFMEYEHELSEEVNPIQMKGYNYLVRGEHAKLLKDNKQHNQKRLEIKGEEVITIHKIWQCDEGLLTSTADPDSRLKDICLSFALHKLLCRQFVGYPLHECHPNHGLEKTWRFVRNGLLSKEDEYERAFRVIEVELAFVFDLFYTKYPVIFEPGNQKYRIIQLLGMTVGFWLAISLLSKYQTNQGQVNVNVWGHNIDVLLTGIVIFVIVLLEIIQLVFIIFSDWAKVILLCKYVQKPSWRKSKCIGKMIGFVCKRQWFKPWEGKIGQYSLLTSFNHEPSIWKYNCMTRLFLDYPEICRNESAPIKLPAAVKRAIILFLKNNVQKIDGRRVTNGKESLRLNGVWNELYWVFRCKTNTHVIMLWHIATSLCELELSKSGRRYQTEHFIVATTLSKYCAYLVAFAPGFLPGNAYLSEFVFNEIVIETRDKLKESKIGEFADGDAVIEEGAKLGKYLIHKIKRGELIYWKIVAEFWTEMILFVALSGDATIHAEYLAKGGQFVTHLWALLSHAGIVKVDSVVPEI